MSRRLLERARNARMLALLAIAACGGEPVTPLPQGAQPFTPDPVYREWWQQMEVCSGREAPYDAITWYVVPGEEPFSVRGLDRPVVGYWDPHDNRIVLLQFLPNQRAPVIRHEALHAILHRTDHPAEFFVTKCGAVIDGPDNPD